jgi:hypothetical protein
MAIKKHLTKLFFILGLFILPAALVLAVPPASEYEPGATLNPDCAPGSTNCTVDTLWNIDTVNDYVYNLTDKIGIGTSVPSAALDVRGDSMASYVDGSEEALAVTGPVSDFGGIIANYLNYSKGSADAKIIAGDGSLFGPDVLALLGVSDSSSNLDYNFQLTKEAGFGLDIDPDTTDNTSAQGLVVVNPAQALFATQNSSNEEPAFTVAVQGSLGIANLATPAFRVLNSGAITMPELATSSGTPDALCYADSDGELTYNSGTATCTVSSARFKQDIVDLDLGLEFVNNLQPHSFAYKDSPEDTRVGFIAEEVAELDDRLVFYEPDGTTVRGVHYQDMTAVLVNAVQDISSQLTARAVDLIDGVREIFVKKVTTDELCIEDRCLTVGEIDQLLNLIDSDDSPQSSHTTSKNQETATETPTNEEFEEEQNESEATEEQNVDKEETPASDTQESEESSQSEEPEQAVESPEESNDSEEEIQPDESLEEEVQEESDPEPAEKEIASEE